MAQFYLAVLGDLSRIKSVISHTELKQMENKIGIQWQLKD